MTTLLETRNLTAFYGDFQALFGVDITVGQGETVALIGSNGAGKSTFLRTLTGLLPAKGQDIRFEGQNIAGWAADRIHKAGIAMVPEGRRLFASLTVEENLLIGASGKRAGPWSLEKVYEIFPDLIAKKNNPGTALSGGQQQMVAIGRALMSNPTLLLCDEISLGLAPKVIKDIYEAVPLIREGGTSILVVEQDVGQAMAVADRVYCFMEGRVTLSGKPADLTKHQIAAAYFGAKNEGEAA
ncbi:ABC transporter ATP-binding protein [Celeribacter persicus]|uniref:Amino acid/amide ABC transporter ATP-binding protein 2 (HAAT family) n=1 Tax=Celeribacter persicus TaxID=1651082 RepID=A0A2T5H536_9RHOB|nr:ABC transporter ATP-binding protein [Celeribacter persicus]PTQ66698.1 amino acid/amide ABC transporter ATP-binding protein 2 (HAAT family) [Celeribacter persicus]